MSDEARKVMITVRKAPHGSIYAQEAIEVMFIVASYGMDLSVVFMDDGVLALKSGQNTQGLGLKGFMASIGALIDFEVSNVYVDAASLAERNLSEEDLVYIGADEQTDAPIRPAVLAPAAIAALMAQQHSIMSF